MSERRNKALRSNFGNGVKAVFESPWPPWRHLPSKQKLLDKKSRTVYDEKRGIISIERVGEVDPKAKEGDSVIVFQEGDSGRPYYGDF